MARKHPLADCESCPLWKTGKFLPSEGPQRAEIAIVGDAPSKTDIWEGTSMTGPGGALLKKVLDYHNLDRDELFVTHATLCRPPDYSTPPTEAIRACNARLIHELEEVGAKKVIAMGNAAAEATLGRSKVTQLRVGPPKKSKFSDQVEVIPTVHPASCLRVADQFPDMVSDFGKVKYVVQHFREPDYLVTDGERHTLDVLDAIQEQIGDGPVAVDIEVDIEKDIDFGHPNQYGMLCVGISYAPWKSVVISEHDMERESVRDRLRSFLKAQPIIAHNGKFDLAGLHPLIGMMKLWFDTMLASYVVDERPGIHALDYLAQEFLGAPDWKSALDKYNPKKNGYGAVPRPVLYKYNAYDAACTYMLAMMYQEMFKEEPELGKLHDFLVAASDALTYTELNGFAVDRGHLRNLDRRLKAQIAENRAIVDSLVPKDYDKLGGLNPNSPQQVKAALTDFKINVGKTDEDTLVRVQEALITRGKEQSNEYKFVEHVLKHRGLIKSHGTYVKGIEKRLYKNGRIYSSYLLHGTTTGRLASRNPNMQNIPRVPELRNIFKVSKEENVLIQTDYSQAELRVLTFLAQDEYFRSIFNDPTRDLFDELTPILYPSANKDRMTKEAWKELRIRVKAYVYGLSYGREAKSIAMEYGMPVKQAVQEMQRFFSAIPNIVTFREETKEAVMRGEDLVTPFGRRRRYGLLTKHNHKSVMNEALAFLPQSTASDICLRALTTLRPELSGLGYVRNTIHDALIVECHEDDKEEVIDLMQRHMLASAEQLVGDYVKFAVESTVGKSWGAL